MTALIEALRTPEERWGGKPSRRRILPAMKLDPMRKVEAMSDTMKLASPPRDLWRAFVIFEIPLDRLDEVADQPGNKRGFVFGQKMPSVVYFHEAGPRHAVR